MSARWGNRLTQLDFGGVLTEWSYDAAAYQLTGETRSGMNAFDLEYAYDRTGNRIRETNHLTTLVVTSTYDGANQLLHSDAIPGRTSYTYDLSGNRVQKETPSALTYYAWDEDNRMTAAEPPRGSSRSPTSRRGRHPEAFGDRGSAGINRLGVGNARVLRGRLSQSLRPSAVR